MFEPRHPSRHLVIGVLIVLLGFVLLLDQLGFVEAGKVFLFWPLILIYFGLRKLLGDQNSVGRFWGGFLTLLGISFQLEELGFNYIRIATIWPVFLICVGVLLILRRYENRSNWEDHPVPPPAPTPGAPNVTSDAPPPIDVPPPAAGTPNVPGSVPPPMDVPPPGSVPPPFGGPHPGAGPQTQANFGQDYARGAREPADPWRDFGRRMDEFGERMRSSARPWNDFQQRTDDYRGRMHGSWQAPRNWSATSEPRLNLVNVFWGGRRRYVTKNFLGGEVVSIFGGFDIDLTEADIQGPETHIEIVTIFGGGEIRVPANWEVVLENVGIFGGASDRTRHPEPPSQSPSGSGSPAGPPPKKLIIKGVSIFGGLNVKN
ncbi:MAG: cell wall-active antibiotics response protein [Acidobacteriia bacterium]|nr:cell wall-active antibiotics response protein [Terriglobia bacterium]